MSKSQKASEPQKGAQLNISPMYGVGSLAERVARIEAALPYFATSKQVKEVKREAKRSIDNLRYWILGATLAQIVILMATIIGVP